VDPALAAQAALRGVHADPKHINGIANLGYIELQRGRFAESESWSRKALELDPDNIRALNNLALALRRQRRLEESIEIARRAHELDPTDSAHSLTLGISLGLAGRNAEAANAYRKTLKLSPGDVQAANNLAFILFEQGQRDGEVRDLLRVASVAPGGVPHAPLTLARILEAEQAWPEVVEVLERGLVLFAERARGPVRSPSPLQVSILHRLTLALLQCGRLDEAEARAREALSLDPRHTVTILALGNVSVARGHYIEALARYREAADADPGDADMASQVAELEKVIRTQAAAEGAILAMRAGADPAVDPKLGLEMARLAERRGWHATAARLFELVIARAGADAPLLVLAEAARSAALAGAGTAEECTRLPFEERARWRRTALEWLERELVAGERRAPSRRVELLEERLVDEAFAALRGENAQILMPGAERKGWMAYWRAVDGILEGAR
jgi:tetratricopeptide (TPR) repeat protein